MPILHVRNVPEPLYKQIQKLADSERRSFSSEVVSLLGQAVHEQQGVYAHKKALAGIIKRTSMRKLKPGAPDSLTLLREDRGR